MVPLPVGIASIDADQNVGMMSKHTMRAIAWLVAVGSAWSSQRSCVHRLRAHAMCATRCVRPPLLASPGPVPMGGSPFFSLLRRCSSSSASLISLSVSSSRGRLFTSGNGIDAMLAVPRRPWADNPGGCLVPVQAYRLVMPSINAKMENRRSEKLRL